VSARRCAQHARNRNSHFPALRWVEVEDNFRGLKKPVRAEIPRKAIYRLSVYLRCLQRLKANEIRTVSSEALAKAARVKSTQLRKDLTYFGQFGTRGLGYDVEQLSKMISDLLGTTSLQPVILVGLGNLGLALLSYKGFEQEGFEIVAAFDVEANRKREKPASTPLYPMERLPEIVDQHGVKMAIITVPASAAQEVANELIDAGVTGILNFAPIVLHVPDEVMVNNVNLAIELENLSYFIQQ
jgi:redox-sensing transcriptional repressor